MQLTDSELAYFVDERLALPGEERQKHLAQVNRLLENLLRVSAEDDTIRIECSRKGGSLMKGTSLRPRPPGRETSARLRSTPEYSPGDF